MYSWFRFNNITQKGENSPGYHGIRAQLASYGSKCTSKKIFYQLQAMLSQSERIIDQRVMIGITSPKIEKPLEGEIEKECKIIGNFKKHLQETLHLVWFGNLKVYVTVRVKRERCEDFCHHFLFEPFFRSWIGPCCHRNRSMFFDPTSSPSVSSMVQFGNPRVCVTIRVEENNAKLLVIVFCLNLFCSWIGPCSLRNQSMFFDPTSSPSISFSS